MKRKIKLISLNRFLTIGITGAILIPLTTIILHIRIGLSAEMFFGLFGILLLLLVFLIRFSMYYTVVAEINDEYVWIGKWKMNWDVIKSYDYEESPLFGKLVLRDSRGVGFKIAGKLKGRNSANFLELVGLVKRKIDGINEENLTNQITQKNFYNSEYAKPAGFFIILFAIVLTVWVIVADKEITTSLLLRLAGFYILLTYVLIRIFKTKR